MIQKRIYNYFERNPRLKVLFMFDRMGGFEAELSEHEWQEDYIFKVFDGKWWNLKVALLREWADKKVVLVFPYELRPDTEEKRLKFPLLDVYASNLEFKDERYEEFMQQYGLSPKVASFVKNNIDELTSKKVMPLLAGKLDEVNFTVDLANRAIVSSYLGDKKALEWDMIIVKMIILSAQPDEKKSNDFYLKLYRNLDVRKSVDDKLKSIFGVTFNPDINDKMRPIAEILKYNAITQSMPPNPADHYSHLKISDRRLLDIINGIYETGSSEPQFSSKFADAMLKLGSAVREEEIINIYGTDAQYFFMTENLMLPILMSVLTKDVMANPGAAIDKIRALSLRLSPDSSIWTLIKFVENAAYFYDSVNALGGLRLDNPSEYISLYTERFCKIDRFYRIILDAFYQLPDLDEKAVSSVSASKRTIDAKYAQLANQLNYEWLECVKDTGNAFDKVGILRQNDFYATYNDTNKLVVIISDGLRYDVAVELYEELAKKKHIATLSPMLSLLPSETKFCKPALFPHNSLKLEGDSMTTDGKILSSVKQKTEQLCRYRNDAICVNFEEVSTQISSHRELFKKPLVYVMHDRIDRIGHDQSISDLTDSCRKTVEELARFVNSLHMTLNCSNVIITSDHGFLLNDIIFEDKDKLSISEKNIEATTRYYLTTERDKVEEVEKININKASTIETDVETFVATPMGTNRFAASGGYKYTHGGASLQEMVLPLICSKLRRESSKRMVDVLIKNNNLNMVSSRLNFQLVQKEAVSMEVIAREVVCRIYDGDRLVSDEVKVSLDSTDAMNIAKRTYDVTLKLKESGVGNLLQLRVYDADPSRQLNPLVKETVRNNTIIEQDF